MSFPDLEFRTSPIRESDAEAILLALPPLDDAADALAEWPGLHGALEAVGFTGARSSYLRVAAPEATRLPLAVVGTGTSPGEQDVRAAVGAGVRSLTGFDTVAVAAPAFQGWRAVAEGATLGGYRFDSYKSTPPPARAATVVVHGETRPDRGELEAVRADAEAMALVKDLSTMPADRLGPADFADRACRCLSTSSTRPTSKRADSAASSVSDADHRGRRDSCVWTTRRRMRRPTSRSSARASRSTPVDSRSNHPLRWWG